ncbi:MAG: hypothetical protein LBN05_01275 [Oscillospiraceae bacterium]|jgi:hypothetical protein|nr:hypothetical protein [Oscillospiraceae bacterium]
MFRKISADWISPRSDANHRHTYHRKNTRLRVTLSLMLVLALVFGCVGALAGEAMALGSSADGGTGGYVYIRNIKSGMYLTFMGDTSNLTTATVGVVSLGALGGMQKWRVQHGQKADGSYYVVLHSQINDNYVLDAGNGGYGTKLRLSYYNGSSTRKQRFDIIHGAGVARIVSHESYYGTGAWRSIQVQDGYSTTNITSGTDVNQREPYSTPDAKAHQYWVFEDSARPPVNQRPLVPATFGYTVDSGRHCDIDFGSTFPTAWRSEFEEAMASWNKVNGNIFRKDTLLNIEDAYLVYTNNYPPAGYNVKSAAITWQFDNGASNITFYTPNFSQMDDYAIQRKGLFTHELGHLLGIGEGSLVYDMMYVDHSEWYKGTALSINDRLFYQNAASNFNY